MARGSCVNREVNLFFEEDGERKDARDRRFAKAKMVCTSCPVMAQCREWALRVDEPYGVWGAMDADERAVALGKRPDPTDDGHDDEAVELLLMIDEVPADARRVDVAHAAVRLYRQGDTTRRQVGLRFGVGDTVVGNWLERANRGLPPISTQHLRNLANRERQDRAESDSESELELTA